MHAEAHIDFNYSILSPSFVIKACRYRSVKDMEKLFQHYPINCHDSYKNTPLHEAAMWGREDLVKFLLSQGADVKAVDQHGRTPLYWAEKRGYPEIVDILKTWKA